MKSGGREKMNNRTIRTVIMAIFVLYGGTYLLAATLDANPTWRHRAITTFMPVFERFMHLPEIDII